MVLVVITRVNFYRHLERIFFTKMKVDGGNEKIVHFDLSPSVYTPYQWDRQTRGVNEAIRTVFGSSFLGIRLKNHLYLSLFASHTLTHSQTCYDLSLSLRRSHVLSPSFSLLSLSHGHILCLLCTHLFTPPRLSIIKISRNFK